MYQKQRLKASHRRAKDNYVNCTPGMQDLTESPDVSVEGVPNRHHLHIQH